MTARLWQKKFHSTQNLFFHSQVLILAIDGIVTSREPIYRIIASFTAAAVSI